MVKVDQSDLAIVFRNPDPRRELEDPSTWLLLKEGQVLKVVITHDAQRRPHISWTEAA